MDENYDPNSSVHFNNGGYRVIHINCDVDVAVKDADGNVVASIVNEEPQNIGSIISSIDENGQKTVVLPADSTFDVAVTARNDDKVNIGISEYSASEGNFTRNVNYFDVDMKAGQTINETMPAYSDEDLTNGTSNGSSTQYKLQNGEKLVTPNSDLKGSDATSAVYTVSVKSDNEKYGIATGAGTHNYGEFAQVEANAFEGYKFIGWYVDDTCVSTDASYRFCVKNDVSVVAKFEVDPDYHGPDSNITDGDGENPQPEMGTDGSPDTGDATAPFAWGMSLLLSAAMMLYFSKKSSLKKDRA